MFSPVPILPITYGPSVPLSGLTGPLPLPLLLSPFPPEIPLRPSLQVPRVARILCGPSTSLLLHPLHACTLAPLYQYPVFFPGIFFNNFPSSINSLSTPPTTVLSLFPTVPSIHNVSDASFVLYHHRAFGSPVLSTFLKAIRAGYLASIPRLTATIVLRNPPFSLATSFGHLDACRKGLHSTRQSFPPSLLALTRAQHRATLTNTPPLTPIPLHVPPPYHS